jgi:HSP20 family molecular chaperone IbpA
MRDPVQDIVSWHERLRRAPGGSTGWSPPVDIYETPADYVVVVELAGLSASDFDVHATDERLTVSGQRASGSADGRFIHVERGHGGFSRTFAFPLRVDVAGVRGDFHDGLLTITVPKLAHPDAQRIDIG